MAKKDTRNNNYIKGTNGRVQNYISGFVRAFFVLLLVLLQFAIIIVVPLYFHHYATIFYIVMEFAGVFCILSLTNDNRSMAYKFAWLCIIVALPISGNIMFLLWGKVAKSNKLSIRIKDQIEKVDEYLDCDDKVLNEFISEHPVSSRMSTYMQAEKSPIYKNNEVKYYKMGEDAFEDIFVDLENAKEYIFIEFFIVAEGALWDKFFEVLKRKIKEGVEVKFLYDDFGALTRTGKDFALKLREEGIQVEIFNPIHKYASKLFMNFRDHQKLVIIDGKVGYTGGFNLADEYANLIERFGVWKDAGIRIKGDSVWGMTIVFLELWMVCAKEEKLNIPDYKRTTDINNKVYCHILRDGPALDNRSFVGTMYKQMIQYSKRKLYVMTPYLILEDFMINTFLEAAKRGVDVRIITPNIPDKKYIKQMTQYNYGELLKNGVRIYEYTPGFIHSKVVMSEHCAIVGTINMDYRSFYLHYENGVFVYDREFLDCVENDFVKTFEESKEITYEEWRNRPRKNKIVQTILHVFDTLA